VPCVNERDLTGVEQSHSLDHNPPVAEPTLELIKGELAQFHSVVYDVSHHDGKQASGMVQTAEMTKELSATYTLETDVIEHVVAKTVAGDEFHRLGNDLYFIPADPSEQPTKTRLQPEDDPTVLTVGQPFQGSFFAISSIEIKSDTLTNQEVIFEGDSALGTPYGDSQDKEYQVRFKDPFMSRESLEKLVNEPAIDFEEIADALEQISEVQEADVAKKGLWARIKNLRQPKSQEQVFKRRRRTVAAIAAVAVGATTFFGHTKETAQEPSRTPANTELLQGTLGQLPETSYISHEPGHHSIWSIAKADLKEHGNPNPQAHQIAMRTYEIQIKNNIDDEEAQYLQDGTLIVK